MKSFFKGFAYAGAGVAKTLCERNMRIHTCVTAYMFYFLICKDFFTLTKTQLALLCVMCALVLSLECVNTAVESVVDLVTKEKNSLAKVAKDAAAGAVLIAATFSVAVGLILLWQPAAFKVMFNYYLQNIFRLILLLISLIVAAYLVFGFKSKQRNNK